MISAKEASEKIAAMPHPKVTVEMMEKRVVSEAFEVLKGTTVTICNITLDNGYSVRGESACVDKRNFNMEVGERLARDDAFRKLWPLFGFMLAEDRHRREHLPTVEK